MGTHVVYANVPADGENRGGLFKDMKFWISAKCPLRNRFKDDVLRNGGEVVQREQEAHYLIIDHLKDNGPGKHSYKYIEDCLKAGRVLDASDYEQKPISRGMGDDHDRVRRIATPVGRHRGGSTRKFFTVEEDQLLYDCAIFAEQNGEKLGGNEFWRKIEAKFPRHTFHSWRDRWHKYLKYNPRPELTRGQSRTAAREQQNSCHDDSVENQPDPPLDQTNSDGPTLEAKMETLPPSSEPKLSMRDAQIEVAPPKEEGSTDNNMAGDPSPIVSRISETELQRSQQSLQMPQKAQAENERQLDVQSRDNRHERDKQHEPYFHNKPRKRTHDEEAEVKEPQMPMQPHPSKRQRSPTSRQTIQSQSSRAESTKNPLEEVKGESLSSPLDKPMPHVLDGAADEDEEQPQFVKPATTLDTQAIFALDTQLLDLDIPEPEGGWEAFGEPAEEAEPERLQSSVADGDEVGDIDGWIETQTSAGYEMDNVLLALKCTSMQADLAQIVLDSFKNGHGIPPDIPGVWSEEDDAILEGSDGRKLRQVEEKHGAKAFNLRMEFLESYREC
ncbi:hypothetical protein L228DRAFT_262224 [Xylona heveae TC161]|uniref:DNA-binding protein RAP1 n=1 Tax=Xylona heveae (strain CBS 132557 / TC161) TaxID=1328760 RepID=A0A165FN00_XYLHT|nr:hypothetical protein L228DRAFT_262224 [Xylona heveae TC161]KZF21175.1 hypothetical protein L228DRAFT_262224 [Xylona heveae TC161]